MINTIRHQDIGRPVLVAKLLTGYLSINAKVANPESFIQLHQEFDAGFVAYILAWQSNRGLASDGIIGPATWTAIAKQAPTVSTSKNRKTGIALAVQILLDGNITPDAIYGPRTKAAVAAFQSYKGLGVDGVCGPKTWNALITGSSATVTTPSYQGSEDTASTAAVAEPICDECKIWLQPVDYKQYDSRWGKKMYSNHGDAGQTMANSACGPTAMADIVATVKDKDKTPYDLAKLAIELGDRTYNSGTAWSFFIPHIMERFGFSKAIKTATLEGLKACLDAGGYVVCSMGPGYWTKGGHFICAWKYDATYIYANDPASAKRTNQEIKQFMKERKQFFCFYPEEIAPSISTGYEALAPETPAASSDDTGTEIIDISKHQGNINFDKLKKKVALVIARAGLGSDPDVRFEEYAQAMNDRGIPFGVYCYSYAGTVEKARDEAQKIVARAVKFKPLFYVMDAEEERITTAAIRAFAEELRSQGATHIGCYVAHHRYKEYKFDTVRDAFDFVWIPRYGKNDGTLEGATKPSYKCDLWQYTSVGKIDGIDGNVDKNVITGQGRTLEWLRGGDD